MNQVKQQAPQQMNQMNQMKQQAPQHNQGPSYNIPGGYNANAFQPAPITGLLPAHLLLGQKAYIPY